jgi:hypothetical protein
MPEDLDVLLRIILGDPEVPTDEDLLPAQHLAVVPVSRPAFDL